MPTLEATATIIINDGERHPGEFVIEQDIEMVRSDRATKPDPKWTFTDDQGHFHAFVEDGGLPTLDRTVIDAPCDGSCGGVCQGEGYTITKYTCRICGQQIEPNWIPDVEARTVGIPLPGMKSASVTIRGDRRLLARRGSEVTVRAVAPSGQEFIGVGVVTNFDVTSDGDSEEVVAMIHMRSLEPRLTP